jgi:hypothetical protein
MSDLTCRNCGNSGIDMFGQPCPCKSGVAGGSIQCGGVPIIGDPGPEIYITLCATCKQSMEPNATGDLCCYACGHAYPQLDTVPIVVGARPLAIDIYLHGEKIAEVRRK